MQYSFRLAPRTFASPPLLRALESQLENWIFSSDEYTVPIHFKLCPLAIKELPTLNLTALRQRLHSLHHLHPDTPIHFYQYSYDPLAGKAIDCSEPVFVHRGMKRMFM